MLASGGVRGSCLRGPTPVWRPASGAAAATAGPLGEASRDIATIEMGGLDETFTWPRRLPRRPLPPRRRFWRRTTISARCRTCSAPKSRFTHIPQDGPQSDALKDIVQHINVPDGFEASLYAVVPDARSMAVAPQGTVVFVGTRKDKVWSVVDRDRNRVADEVMDFAPSITFDVPNGPCFSPDGFLYIAERNRVLQFPAAEFFFEGPDVAVGTVVAQGELIPPEEESFNHTARVCRVGPDGKLYISLGQPHNVQPQDKLRDVRRARHRRHHPDEPGRVGAARSTPAASATRSGTTSTRRTATCGSPTTRPTAWATTSRRAN